MPRARVSQTQRATRPYGVLVSQTQRATSPPWQCHTRAASTIGRTTLQQHQCAAVRVERLHPKANLDVPAAATAPPFASVTSGPAVVVQFLVAGGPPITGVCVRPSSRFAPRASPVYKAALQPPSRLSVLARFPCLSPHGQVVSGRLTSVRVNKLLHPHKR